MSDPTPHPSTSLRPGLTHERLEVELTPDADPAAARGAMIGIAVLLGALALGVAGVLAQESLLYAGASFAALLATGVAAVGVLAWRAAPSVLRLDARTLTIERRVAGWCLSRREIALGSLREARAGEGPVPGAPGNTRPGVVLVLRDDTELFLPTDAPPDAIAWLVAEIGAGAAHAAEGDAKDVAPELEALLEGATRDPSSTGDARRSANAARATSATSAGRLRS